MKKKRPSKIAQQPEPPVLLLEAEIAQGLEQLVWDELQEQFGDTVRLEQMGQAAIRFWYRGALRRFWTPLAQSVYHVQTFDVPRPKALLGDQHFRALTTQIDRVRQLSPKDYQSFYVNAAGSESSIMQRLRQILAASTGLADRPEQGDLLIRIRRSPGQESSWETLVRISPRPFATR